MKIAALIPARAGSKAIPFKNIQPIGTLPMLAYTVLAAVECRAIDAVYVSSESETILDVARLYGAEAIERPEELAQDNSTTESVVEHFLTQVEPSIIVLIQPTSPMLQSEDLTKGIIRFEEGDIDSLFSAVKVNDMLVWEPRTMSPMNYNPMRRGFRQKRRSSTILIENGAFFIFTRAIFNVTHCRLGGIVGYSEMPYWRSFQVDSAKDLYNVSLLMTRKL